MQLHSYNNYSGGNRRVWLYSVVFAGKFSVMAILLLFLSFFIQPFHQALANEALAPEEEQTLPTEVEEQLPQPVEEVAETAPEEIVEEVPDVVDETVPTETLDEESADTEIIDTPDTAAEDTVAESEPDTSTETDVATASTDSDTTENTASSSTDTEEDLAENTPTEDSSNQDTATASSTEDVVEDVEEETNATSTDTDNASSTDNQGGSTGGSSDSGSDEVVADDNSTDNSSSNNSSNDTSADSTPASTDNSESDDMIDGEAIENGVNDLLDEVVNEVVTLTRQLVTEENYYQFSRQSCVAVGDGTFHCTTKNNLSVDPDSAVYAEKDEDGDMEIYMRTSKGDVKQLTDNDLDDTSPDFDLASMKVVWQRMIDGRYQIISYDLEKREETQLTFSRTNSMEPKVSSEGIVWQAWDGNDWEVLYFDGQFTDQITDNETQDVTPVIEDGYILWSVLGGKESEARVYSLESGETMTITGHEGGTVANPRFVLVYDTKFDNGDIVTQGFDPVTGLAEPIASKPAEMPFDIPEPDPVGEIRALIQNKSSNDKKDVVTVPVADDDGDLNLASSTASSTDTLNLIGSDLDFDADIPLTPTEPDFELTEYDLVITPVASSTKSQMNAVYEVVSVPDQTASSTE